MRRCGDRARCRRAVPAARPVVRASRWKLWLPLLIAAALAAGVAAWLTRDWWTAPASPAAPATLASLVVEPFEVVSSGDRALAEGIGEVVMERVRLLPGVRVVVVRARPRARRRRRPRPC